MACGGKKNDDQKDALRRGDSILHFKRQETINSKSKAVLVELRFINTILTDRCYFPRREAARSAQTPKHTNAMLETRVEQAMASANYDDMCTVSL